MLPLISASESRAMASRVSASSASAAVKRSLHQVAQRGTARRNARASAPPCLDALKQLGGEDYARGNNFAACSLECHVGCYSRLPCGLTSGLYICLSAVIRNEYK